MSTPTSFMVCTKCMTFNHHAYIEDAMNGFCMQETNFPFVCVIIDDASTDGEQEVIKKYFDLHFDQSETAETEDYIMTFGQHKTNKNCYFAVLYLKYNHYSIKKSKIPYYSRWQDNSKYIALCEGDDYWIDSTKLQLQADFMENNKDYVLCGCNGFIYYERLAESPKYFNKIIESRELQPSEVINKWILPTASLFYRKDLVIIRDPKFVVGDIVVALSALKSGKIYCFSKMMTIYRVIYGGSILHNMYADKQIDLKYGFIYIFKKFMTLMPQYKLYFDISINKKNNEIAFLKLKRKSHILCFCRFPKKNMKDIAKRIYNYLKKKIK